MARAFGSLLAFRLAACGADTDTPAPVFDMLIINGTVYDGSLQPGYCGIRPKLQGPGDPVAAFVIQDSVVHGIEGLIQLYGIESPGLPSSLAIAELVEEMLKDRL